MNNKLVLSIVTPTRGDFSEYWLGQLLKIKGDVEFILIYPPKEAPRHIDDPRARIMVSPFKGEVMQRAVGLLNVQGEYVLGLDDDDFVHPDIAGLVRAYFSRFPESWTLRLRKEGAGLTKTGAIPDWQAIPDIGRLEVCSRAKGNASIYEEGKGMLEVPIAPLENRFDIRFLFWPFTRRKDHHGIHMENFVDRVWRANIVKDALADLLQATRIIGPIRWVPFWNLDRALSLFIQAKFFQRGLIIGHWMPAPVQFLKDGRSGPDSYGRFIVAADILLVKRFPRYGYFWNLAFEGLWSILRTMFRILKHKLSKSKKA